MRSLNVDALHIFVGIATILINLAPKVPGFVLAALVACKERIPAADNIGTWTETQVLDAHVTLTCRDASLEDQSATRSCTKALFGATYSALRRPACSAHAPAPRKTRAVNDYRLHARRNDDIAECSTLNCKKKAMRVSKCVLHVQR